ncbi:MAG: DNA topoisomerase IV subunit A [Devosiaceae bacterium]|nr:DNA topoisomerase IV subunit A [Devosiaceae bacterium]
MSDNDLVAPIDKETGVIDLKKALEERYLSYALSTITQRALPDVRDGLKPVHRRILHAMRLLKLDPSQGYKKSARIIGDVIGKYHPHGEQSVYDALVRLAQDFAVRYPLVDGQGNFGNIDGDSAAAMRYTESRMTDVAARLMEGINEDAVDFKDTYDGEDNEPIVVPANFPNLLANGSSGIAVGMATSIPPHNVYELCNAALYLIHHPNASIPEIMKFIPGPDFPTGGIIVEDEASIEQAYKTGRGGFRVRSRWEIEETGRGLYQIIVTEIPYGVQKSRLIEKIADLLLAKKLPLLKDVRDESTEFVRLVLEPKNRAVDAKILMESLFKLTDLENRISLNLNVLDMGKVPKVMSIVEALGAWLKHRKVVLVRRSNFRLRQIEHRLELLGGYLIAYLNIDEVIRIIRFEDEPKAELISQFSLSDVQAEAVLNMRLRSLRKLEEFEIKKEHDALTLEQEQLNSLLASDKKQWGVITNEIEKLKLDYSPSTATGKRRTSFEKAPLTSEIDLVSAMIEKEPITIILSEKGWIKTMKGHNADANAQAFKSGDELKIAIKCETTDKILLLSTGGKVFTLSADKLPSGRGHGEPVRIMLDIEEGHDIVDMFVYKAGAKRLLASDIGNGFIVPESALIANTKKGKQVLNVSGVIEAKICVPAVGDHIAIIGKNRKLLVFPVAQLPEMNRGKGVRLQKYKDGGISDARIFDSNKGLSWSDSSGRTYVRTMEELRDWIGERAQAGRQPPTGFPKNNRFNG